MIAWFHEPLAAATEVSGGKGACLSRMSAWGLPVPRGFVVCAEAFQEFLGASNGHVPDVESILSSVMPRRIADAIRSAYGGLGDDVPVAVRSSAVCEDGASASFAGQQETFLNVRGTEAVIQRVKECWASFYSPRAVFYRKNKGDAEDTRMAVVVQEMILADKSGVMFTIDPVRKTPGHVVIEAVFGLGEGIVSGLITPDHYVLDRRDGSLVREFVAMQLTAIVDAGEGGTRQIDMPEEQGAARVLDGPQVDRLLQLGLRLERFFGGPQDIEWCTRGDEIFLLQSRPITTL
jgi:pyruvate,water dikinase